MKILIIVTVLILLLPVLFVFGSFGWHHSRTKGLAYFGGTRLERQRFRTQVSVIGKILRALFGFMGGKNPDPNQYTNQLNGLYLPANVCSKASLEFASRYEPKSNDVFVVTPMKCGTTWMQQIVYETLMKGNGDFSDEAHGHLFATSPWLESFNGVSINEAPLLGEQKLRLIKTHLPSGSCPFSDQAKYIYVTRHPASCFASCLDFFKANAGELTPNYDTMLDWFCSNRMWWGSWPAHVEGFWNYSQIHSNVLFLTFEEMKADLPGVVARVAEFLGTDLIETQKLAVVEKSGFEYMKAQEEQFEMLAPGFFATGDSFFPSGSKNRFDSLNLDTNERIAEFVRSGLRKSDFPLAKFYQGIAKAV
ncbi:MAG: sulfotransferase domain-containing protein [Verrucomicrobiales bacterium]|nr:sulfotransferase domain-containing protein [Verrucomicrobiales bacterium]